MTREFGADGALISPIEDRLRSPARRWLDVVPGAPSDPLARIIRRDRDLSGNTLDHGFSNANLKPPTPRRQR